MQLVLNINSMSDNQWTQQFYYQRQLSKATLTRKSIAIEHPLGFQAISLDFNSYFSTHSDSYDNLTHIVIQGSQNICLGHDNPTVLSQWVEILSKILHKTDFLNEFQPREKIGEGISASVFLALRKRDRKKVAVKVFCKSKLRQMTQLQALQNEIQILKSITGEFFPSFVATFLTKNNLYLIYQWCEGISLKQWVNKGLSNQKQMKYIVMQICKGLKLLNSYNIVHRDIKPENIIYNPANRQIKIVDFGFATSFTQRQHIYPNCGSPGYAAPQLLDKENTVIEPKVDIFSLGVTIYFLVFAKLPYQSKYSLIKANKDCKFHFDQSLVEKRTLYDLLKGTICPLKHRLSLLQLQNHSYFKQNEHQSTHQMLKNQFFLKLRRNQMQQLDSLNQKIEIKREQRIKRERIISLRAQSQLKRFSREKSIKIKKHFLTQMY